MSTRHTIRPGFLRKVAVVSIFGGLVICAALYGLRTLPMLVGAAAWAGAPTGFIPLVDGLLVVGISAHLAATVIVLHDRNPGLGRFVGRTFGGGRPRVEVVVPRPDDDDAADEAADYGAEQSEDALDQPASPARPLSERMARGWANLRRVLTSRRGSPPAEPPADDAPMRPTSDDDVLLLGSSEDDDVR